MTKRERRIDSQGPMLAKLKQRCPLRLRTLIKCQWRFIRDNSVNRWRVRHKRKIFCIGMNKTGTTSFQKAMRDLGFIAGTQRTAEKLLKFYAQGNFQPIVNYCRTAQVFQDFPFSAPETYRHLDKAYPGSKFVLTVRDSPEQWYNSLVAFHSRRFGKGRCPTKSDLRNAAYIYKGRPWDYHKLIYNAPDNDPYSKAWLIERYIRHNEEVAAYFRERPDDLLTINLADKDSYRRLMDFLGLESPFRDFPWENRTADMPIR